MKNMRSEIECNIYTNYKETNNTKKSINKIKKATLECFIAYIVIYG